MTDDVVVELDEWLKREATTLHHYPNDDTDTDLLERARSEIMALRETVERQKLVLSKGHAETRDAALEEAARVCDEPVRRLREELGWPAEADLLERYAAAIRILKNER